MISPELKKIFMSRAKKNVYLETGFLFGESAKAALEIGFTKVISIEINNKYVEKAKINFKNYIDENKLEIIKGDSASVLENVLVANKMDVSVIFLDAHDGPNNPLMKELNIIKKFYQKDITIIIDDFAKIKNSYGKQNESWKSKNNYKEILETIKQICGNYFVLHYKTPSEKFRLNSYLISGNLFNPKIFWHVFLFYIKLILSSPTIILKKIKLR